MVNSFRTFRHYLIYLLALGIFAGHVDASELQIQQSQDPPPSIATIIARSTIICVVKLPNFTNKGGLRTKPLALGRSGTNDIEYLVHPIRSIKGAIPGDIYIPGDSIFFQFLAKQNPVFWSHAFAIIYLSSVENGEGQLSESRMLFSPILPTAVNIRQIQDTDDYVVRMMILSLASAPARELNLPWLRLEVNPLIPDGVRSYLNASNGMERDFILICLARNHDIGCLQVIVDDIHKHPDQGSSALEFFPEYTDKKVLPIFNKFICDKNVSIRYFSLLALEKLADRSSISSLLVAANFNDSAHYDVSYMAYRIIYRILPELGRAKSFDEFENNQQTTMDSLISTMKSLNMIDATGHFQITSSIYNTHRKCCMVRVRKFVLP